MDYSCKSYKMQILFKEFLGRPKERQKQEHKKKLKLLTQELKQILNTAQLYQINIKPYTKGL